MKSYTSNKCLSLNKCFCARLKCAIEIVEYHVKVHTFLNQIQWKSENQIFWSYPEKVSVSHFPGLTSWSLFSVNVTLKFNLELILFQFFFFLIKNTPFPIYGQNYEKPDQTLSSPFRRVAVIVTPFFSIFNYFCVWCQETIILSYSI